MNSFERSFLLYNCRDERFCVCIWVKKRVRVTLGVTLGVTFLPLQKRNVSWWGYIWGYISLYFFSFSTLQTSIFQAKNVEFRILRVAKLHVRAFSRHTIWRKAMKIRKFSRLWRKLRIQINYSMRIRPSTSATALISEHGNSNGSYSLLSDTISTWSLSLPGLMRLMSAPCFVSST